VTSDFYEEDGTLRSGLTVLDNVEVYNCSQKDTAMSAIRFEGAYLSYSSVTNSVIRHGRGIGVTFKDAANQTFINNTLFNFYGAAITLDGASFIVVKNNWVFGVRSQGLASMSIKSNQIGISVCARKSRDNCNQVYIQDNIVGGIEGTNVDSVGFVVPGHKCGFERNQT